jgi:hypothetical protein
MLVDDFFTSVMIWRDLAFLIAGFLLGVSVAFWVLASRVWF